MTFPCSVKDYFAEAAAGYNFDEDGEEQLDTALVTLGLKAKGEKLAG